MCQARVYLGDQVVAEEVIGLEPTEEGVRVAVFFEEPMIVPGRIRHIDFLRHRVSLEPLDEVRDEGD
jgi:predicted RNA-binding protein